MSEHKPSILFAEDEVFIGLETKLLLEDAGYEVIGPVASVVEALKTLESRTPDVALLDVNLNGGRVTPVAERLAARHIPFALLTGYSSETFAEPVLRNAVLLRKPLDEGETVGVLERLLGRPPSEPAGGAGAAS